MPWIKIKKGLTHRSGTLQGGDVVEVSRAEVVSFGDKFELLGDEEPILAPTDAAIAYAEEHGLDLSNVQGTGKNGRITLPDVKAIFQDLPDPGGEEDGNS